jgi:hypothetical protein
MGGVAFARKLLVGFMLPAYPAVMASMLRRLFWFPGFFLFGRHI